MRNKKLQLSVEQLEDRSVPATLTNLWPDATHLTLSFVPDGTSVSGTSSNLFGTLNATGATAAWEQTILKAFQTWAAQSNINVAVVADSGLALGSPGALEGDPRFGDIRVAMAPVANASVATGTPPSVSAGTWSGDLVLNSNFQFGSGAGQYDLYTVALHEAGHVFGLGDNAGDNKSAMFPTYVGARTGPNAADVALLQAAYGTNRPANAAANATALGGGGGGDDGGGDGGNLNVAQFPNTGGGSLTATAALATVGEADYYAFQIDNGSHPGGVNIQLQTGRLSSLTAKVSIYNSSLQLVATSAATNPQNGNLSLNLGNVNSGDTYYVAVQGASGNVFDIGAYQVSVNLHPNAPPSLGQTVIKQAQDLKAQSATTTAPSLVSYGNITASSTSFVYKLQAPDHVTGGLNLYVKGWGVGIVSPSLSLFDSNGNLIGASNTTDANGIVSLNLATVASKQTYYVQVASGTANAAGVGSFRMEADLFQTAPPVSTSAMTQLALSSGQPNTNMKQATKLQKLAAQDQAKYVTVDGITAAGNVNYYLVQPGKSSNLMTVTVVGEKADLKPQIAVYDQSGNLLNATVIANGNGTFAVQVPITGKGNYTVAVSGSPSGSRVGNFFLNVDFQTNVAPAVQMAADTLATTAPQEFRSFTVNQNALYSFALSSTTAAGSAAMQVQMLIFDGSGNLVLTQYATAGMAASTSAVYLPAGKYTVQYLAIGQTAGQTAPVTFNLTGQVLSDPIGPVLYDPSGNVITTPPAGGGGPSFVWSGPSVTATGPVTPYLNPYFYTY